MNLLNQLVILGDYCAFFGRVVRALGLHGIDVTPYPVSHLAFRVSDLTEYLMLRDRIESVSVANVENAWSGKPISKLLLREPLWLGTTHQVSLIELIPPPHRTDHPMGLEHVGFVLGAEFDGFALRHREAITARQDQGPFNQPLLITFDDGTSAKFHRQSLHDVVILEGRRFDGFHHADAGGT